MSMKYFLVDPDEWFNYKLDLTNWLGDDTIADAEIIVDGVETIEADKYVAPTYVVGYFTNATDGGTITFRVTSSAQNLKKDFTVDLIVAET